MGFLQAFVAALALAILNPIQYAKAAVITVNASRMVQYDVEGVEFGSRRALLNQHASAAPGTSPDPRAVSVVPLLKFKMSVLESILDSDTVVGGLVLVLPPNFESWTASSDQYDWPEVEKLLLNSQLPFPVYFLESSPELAQISTELTAAVAAGRPTGPITGGYKLVIDGKEPMKMKEGYKVMNFQGWLPGNVPPHLSSVRDLPTIALIAYYDTFGISPDLAAGADSNGSGVVVLLELARIFNRLYREQKLPGAYNIVLLLTAAGHLNFAGATEWLAGTDVRLLDNIEFALCIDSIGSWEETGGLNLHISRPPKEERVGMFFDELASTAASLNIPFETSHKKINVSNPVVAWEHEQFSKRKIPAATLSAKKRGRTHLFDAGKIGDRRKMVSTDAVVQVIKLISDVMVKHVYNIHGQPLEIFEDSGSMQISEPYVDSWLNTLSTHPRVHPFVEMDSPIMRGIRDAMSQNVEEFRKQKFVIDERDFTFHDRTVATMEVYHVAGVMFDVYGAIIISLYLTTLYVVFFVVTRGVAQAREHFSTLLRPEVPAKAYRKSK